MSHKKTQSVNNNDRSKYSYNDRKYIAQSIENLKNDKDYVAVFKILTSDNNNCYTQNSNGVFLNLSEISDKTLGKVKKYLQKFNESKLIESEIDIDIIPNSGSTKTNRQYKLSNYEKNLIKQRNLKKVLNEDNEYEKLEFATSKSKKNTTGSKSSGKKNVAHKKSSTKTIACSKSSAKKTTSLNKNKSLTNTNTNTKKKSVICRADC